MAHNVSQKRGDLYMDDDEVLENVLINEGLMRGGYNNNQNCPDADALRDVLAEYMFDNIWNSVWYNITRYNNRLGPEGWTGATLDGENMDNCFNSIQVCRFRKSGVNRLKMGHYGRNWTLKVQGHFTEFRNLTLYEFAIK